MIESCNDKVIFDSRGRRFVLAKDVDKVLLGRGMITWTVHLRLRDGGYRVVGRFKIDPEADSWSRSLSVLKAMLCYNDVRERVKRGGIRLIEIIDNELGTL